MVASSGPSKEGYTQVRYAQGGVLRQKDNKKTRTMEARMLLYTVKCISGKVLAVLHKECLGLVRGPRGGARLLSCRLLSDHSISGSDI